MYIYNILYISLSLYIYIYTYICLYVYKHYMTCLSRALSLRLPLSSLRRIFCAPYSFRVLGCTGSPPARLAEQAFKGELRGSQGRGFEPRSTRVFGHVKHDRANCYLRPPFLGTPSVPSRQSPPAWY